MVDTKTEVCIHCTCITWNFALSLAVVPESTTKSVESALSEFISVLENAPGAAAAPTQTQNAVDPAAAAAVEPVVDPVRLCSHNMANC